MGVGGVLPGVGRSPCPLPSSPHCVHPRGVCGGRAATAGTAVGGGAARRRHADRGPATRVDGIFRARPARRGRPATPPPPPPTGWRFSCAASVRGREGEAGSGGVRCTAGGGTHRMPLRYGGRGGDGRCKGGRRLYARARGSVGAGPSWRTGAPPPHPRGVWTLCAAGGGWAAAPLALPAGTAPASRAPTGGGTPTLSAGGVVAGRIRAELGDR